MTKKITKKEDREYNKLYNNAWKDLESYRDKFLNHKSDLNHVAFTLQLTDAMHNILEMGFCVHTLNEMIKESKNQAVSFHKQKYEENKKEVA
jgi:hypothetical protein